MMMTHTPKTIQLFFPTGKPQGIRIAHVTSRIPVAVCIPRLDLAQAFSRPELCRAGIYFLFGDTDDIKKTVYIGESENCLERLKQHNNGDKEWNSVVVIVSKTQELTKCHIRYLEWLCCHETLRIGNGCLKNKTLPADAPFVTESMKADLMEMFDTIALLLSTLDYSLFDEIEQPQENHQMYCGGAMTAKGIKTANGFVVFKDSKANITAASSIWTSLQATRKRLVDGGVLREEGVDFVFTADHLFPSPSQAAGVVLGRQANGWIEWKNSTGQTLDEMFRKEVGDVS